MQCICDFNTKLTRKRNIPVSLKSTLKSSICNTNQAVGATPLYYIFLSLSHTNLSEGDNIILVLFCANACLEFHYWVVPTPKRVAIITKGC